MLYTHPFRLKFRVVTAGDSHLSIKIQGIPAISATLDFHSVIRVLAMRWILCRSSVECF